jgi:hypothetical protein
MSRKKSIEELKSAGTWWKKNPEYRSRREREEMEDVCLDSLSNLRDTAPGYAPLPALLGPERERLTAENIGVFNRFYKDWLRRGKLRTGDQDLIVMRADAELAGWDRLCGAIDYLVAQRTSFTIPPRPARPPRRPYRDPSDGDGVVECREPGCVSGARKCTICVETAEENDRFYLERVESYENEMKKYEVERATFAAACEKLRLDWEYSCS